MNRDILIMLSIIIIIIVSTLFLVVGSSGVVVVKNYQECYEECYLMIDDSPVITPLWQYIVLNGIVTILFILSFFLIMRGVET